MNYSPGNRRLISLRISSSMAFSCAADAGFLIAAFRADNTTPIAKLYQNCCIRVFPLYLSGATNKGGLDPVRKLFYEKVKDMSPPLKDYMREYINLLAGHPSAVDKYVSETLKNITGNKLKGNEIYGVGRFLNKLQFGGKIAWNVATPFINLTQTFINTPTETGLVNFLKGIKHFGVALLSKNSWQAKMLEESKIFKDIPKFTIDDFSTMAGVYEKSVGKLGKTVDKYIDLGSSLFRTSENINRGIAFFSGVNKGIVKKDLKLAMKEGLDVVRKTQFLFGSVDRPLAFSSVPARSLFQFQQFTFKQLEFSFNVIKDFFSGKDLLKLPRYLFLTAGVIEGARRMMGVDLATRVGTIPRGITAIVPEWVAPAFGKAQWYLGWGWLPAFDSFYGRYPFVGTYGQLLLDIMVRPLQAPAEAERTGQRIKDFILTSIPSGVQVKRILKEWKDIDKLLQGNRKQVITFFGFRDSEEALETFERQLRNRESLLERLKEKF